MHKKSEVEIQDYVADFYEEQRYSIPYAVKYHDWWSKKMLSFLGKKTGLVLDNGCGIGNMFEKMCDCSLVGLDISCNMLDKARTRGGNLLCGDSQTLPFPDATFDAIMARSLLHHLPDPDRGVDEMHRVLKPGGEILVVDTNRSILSTLPRVIISRGEHFSEDHKNFRDTELLGNIGRHFRIDNVHYFGYIAYPLLGFPDLTSVYKYFPCKMPLASFLIKLDAMLSYVPIVRKQSWGIIVKATKQ